MENRKQIILAYLEGCFDSHIKTGLSEESALEIAIRLTITKYKFLPIYRSTALDLENYFKEFGAEKFNW